MVPSPRKHGKRREIKRSVSPEGFSPFPKFPFTIFNPRNEQLVTKKAFRSGSSYLSVARKSNRHDEIWISGLPNAFVFGIGVSTMGQQLRKLVKRKARKRQLKRKKATAKPGNS